MRKYAIILVSICITELVYCQKLVDSFSQLASARVVQELRQTIIDTGNSDSSKVIAFQGLSYNLLFSKPDSAMHLAQQGQIFARSINFPEGELLCESAIGSVWWILGDYVKANEVLLDCIGSAESIKDARTWEWALSFLISSYRDQGNYEEAMLAARKGMDGRKIWTERFWNTIIGSVYQVGGKADSAMYFLERSDLASGWAQVILGHTYSDLGNQTMAAACYRNSIELLVATVNYKDLADAYRGLATIHESAGNQDSAIFYASKGLEIARTASFKKWVYELSNLLSRLYEKKDPAASLSFFKLAIKARDSMYDIQKTTESLNSKYNRQVRQQELSAANVRYRNNVRTSVLLSALVLLIIVAIMFYRNQQKQQKARSIVEKSYADLKAAQAMLIQSEKMASLGELTAGIAHEIQNPLNFVNNFSEVNTELMVELKEEIDKGNYEEAKLIAADIYENEEKIHHHGKRADSIVKGMLQHSRKTDGTKEATDINALCDEYLRLAYHGFRAKDKSFNAKLETDFDPKIGKINIVPQDIGRVLLNVINNAFYASKDQAAPSVSVTTKKIGNTVEIKITDNGSGIPENIIDKIFQPFFTTKPTGQGTGLGLSLAYDIVKAHEGQLLVEARIGMGSSFSIELPLQKTI